MEETDKYVMITGSAGGIGRACVSRFYRQGWHVIGIDKNEFGKGFPRNGLFIKADISQPDQFAGIYQEVHAFSPILHALVNNAALQVSKPLIETTVEEWDLVIATNLRPVFLSARYFHDLLVNAGSSAIVNISSVHAVQTSANISAYAASKGGILAITRAMAIEFAPEGIRVNAVRPGLIETEIHASGGLPNRVQDLKHLVPMQRGGTADEVAQAIVWLLSPAASYTTMSLLDVSGGR
jgi:NAD(P)-dependent dehydrogenase (short-subunit alcohol dehydrogenase family)